MHPPPSAYARRSRRLRDSTDAAHRARWGQFSTPPPLARLLASWARIRPGAPVRILDPGAGTGILGLVVARHALERGASSVELVAVEQEPRALTILSEAAREHRNAQLSVEIVEADFLSAPLGAGFDLAVGNPPWLKLSPSEPRGGDAPNAYARFMEVAGGLLRPGGQLLFLVPRSYTSGVYFRRFRQRLQETLSLERAHLLRSRTAAFSEDRVLQEVVAVGYRRGEPLRDTVLLGSSEGLDDLEDEAPVVVERALVERADGRIFLPITEAQQRAVGEMSAWPHTLETLGLAVSTGPVVPFRSEHLDDEGEVPLLWMSHVGQDGLRWPLPGFSKPQHMRADAPEAQRWPRRRAVLVRRLSAVEEARRITAAVLDPGALPGPWIGIENHLNILHRPGESLLQALASALTRTLLSEEVELWIRASSGNTQVNAADLRSLPLPELNRT